MALRELSSPLLLTVAIATPAAVSRLRARAVPILAPFLRPIQQLSIPLPAISRLDLPSKLVGLWESVLRAVPKQKTSHQKTRQRFMAGKALKDVTALNKCSACGNVKRAHLLCPFCVNGPFKPTWVLGSSYADLFQKFEICGARRDLKVLQRRLQRRTHDTKLYTYPGILYGGTAWNIGALGRRLV